MTVYDLIERLKVMRMDEPIAFVLWEPADILTEAESMCVELNDQEIEDVLIDMQENADCEFGMTWTSVRCSIENIIETLNNKQKGEYHDKKWKDPNIGSELQY